MARTWANRNTFIATGPAGRKTTRATFSRGFTIVELLIVIVVIAILAAVILVAYNGITNRAKVSSVQSAATQAARRIAVFASTNVDNFPATLSDANISNSGGTTYQYSVSNSTSPKYYCVTATYQEISYYMTNLSTSPVIGSCPGHTSGNGATISNRAQNPTGKLGTNDWSANWDGGTGTVSSGPVIGALSPTNIDSMVTARWTTASTGSAGGLYLSVPVIPSQQYRMSLWYRYAASASGMRCDALVYDANNTLQLDVPDVSVAAVNNTWGTCAAIFTTPANAQTAIVRIWRAGIVSSGRTLDVTGVMFVEGSGVYAFADGNTSGWSWGGEPNGSTSVGPPL